MNAVHLLMEIKISTYFGKQETRDVIINNVFLDNVKPWQESRALQQGFSLYIENGKEHWFMSRNTRICLEKTNYNSIDLEWEIVDKKPKVIKKILNSYLQKNNYKDLYSIDEDCDRFKYILYKDNGKIVAITKLLNYSNDVETHFFIWNYHNPDLHLGTVSLEHEIWWAKHNGYKYLYTGPGYEQSSIYKSQFPGFEWWTGMEWSNDVEMYNELCKRDSKIRSFKALTSLDPQELP